MDRQDEFEGERSVKLAGVLCRDPRFWDYLQDDNQILTPNEKEATDWMREYLGLASRSELKTNAEARRQLEKINSEFGRWKEKN